MSDNIDYAELDRAVNEAIKNRPKTPVKVATRPRGQFMDFVAARPASHAPARPTRPAVKSVATVAPRPAARPVANPAAKPVMRKVVATQPHTTSTAHKVVKPATKATTKPTSPKVQAKPVEKPAPKLTTKPAPKPAEAPNANNYSLGVRSPFLTDAKVEKRPLGTDIPETSAHALRSTKNVYSSKNPNKSTNTHKKHLIAEAPKKHSGWLWTIIVLLVIAAGGGLGYLLYKLIFAN